MILELLATTVLPALLPAVGDGIKTGINKIFGNEQAASPKTFQDAIALEEMQIKKLEAMSRMDAPVGTPSQWVIDLRASMRYVGVLLILLNYFVLSIIDAYHTLPEGSLLTSGQMASSAFFYLFGDRVYLGLKGLKK